ncbi:histidine phosphatase family protein [Gluconobacter sp. Dm-73]|uniref:histidine phosphatase family protein n=1 Tax=Gluconobacter sp. Dm-73 TaxID=2799802 RepID=UPI001B8C21E6|nr:histidine phosphatase family protein [Gluconobacter sp. Dm-73]MBS1075292.1 histidine phosphatase family protein [Gluconobacter sp. Dm-73]
MTQIIPKPYWYLRHGETDWNARGLAQGRTDIPLNETGIAQAVRAGEALAPLFLNGKRPFDRIVSSPLKRALVTAQYAQDTIHDRTGIKIPLEINAGLIEVCFGLYEGAPMDEWFKSWIEEGRHLENGESFTDLSVRAISTINAELDKDGTPLFVAHGALFRGIRTGMGLPANVRLPNAVALKASPTVSGWSVETT